MAKPQRSHVGGHCLGSRVRETWCRWLLLIWVVGWFLASSHILYFMNCQAVEKRRESLASMCDERARMLQDQFNVSMNHLQDLAILVSTFHHSKNPSAIDQMTLARYAERTAFERQQGWSIKKMYSSKKPSPGPGDAATEEIREPAEEYAPVIFAQDTYKHIVSFDMLSGNLTGKQSIMVNVYDTTNEKAISMYGSNDTCSDMNHVSMLNFGDPSRRYEMHCRFMQSPPWPWLAVISSFGTLLLALLIGHIFYVAVNRIAKVEDDYLKMMVLKKQAEAADVAKSQVQSWHQVQVKI